MGIEAERNQDEVIIQVQGNFNYTLHAKFREICQRFINEKKFIFNLEATEHIDSSALGMLLLLRENVGGPSADIAIIHCKPTVRKTLDMANFGRLFKIS